MHRRIILQIERLGPAYWEVAEIENGEFIRAKYQIPVGNLEDYLEAIADIPVDEKWIAREGEEL